MLNQTGHLVHRPGRKRTTTSRSSLFFAANAPHGGTAPNGAPTPAPRHLGTFAGTQAPRTPSFNEADVSDKPPHLRNLPLLTADQIAAIDRQYQARLESLQSLDEGIGRIIDALAARGELDNTYIFFTSDNGYHLGQHRLFEGKGEVYEEDIRVPLVVRGPGVRGRRHARSPGGEHRLRADHHRAGERAGRPGDGRAVADAAVRRRRAARTSGGTTSWWRSTAPADAARRAGFRPAHPTRDVRGVRRRLPGAVRPPHRPLPAAEPVRDRRPGPHRGAVAAAARNWSSRATARIRAKVESVVVNDGSAQRSMVKSLTVTFDRVVTFDPGAFALERNRRTARSA